MCYIMAEDKVGIRELRQNLSVYLRRVKEGEVLEVTDRGKPVALLVPLPPEDDPLERLIASGRVTRAKGSLNDLPPPTITSTPSLSEILAQMREEERF